MTITYLFNPTYRLLKVAVSQDEVDKIINSMDSWQIVDKDLYYKLLDMYEAGRQSVIAKINSLL